MVLLLLLLLEVVEFEELLLPEVELLLLKYLPLLLVAQVGVELDRVVVRASRERRGTVFTCQFRMVAKNLVAFLNVLESLSNGGKESCGIFKCSGIVFKWW